MKPHWHPLSVLLFTDPPCFASPHLLRMLLKADDEVQLLYAGDRMWPAVTDGATFTVGPLDGKSLRPGSTVVACPEGVPELLEAIWRRLQRTVPSTPSDG